MALRITGNETLGNYLRGWDIKQMMTKEHFEENAVSLIEDIGSFDASEDVIRNCYGEGAPKKFKAFVESQGWVMSPNIKSKMIHVERAKVVA